MNYAVYRAEVTIGHENDGYQYFGRTGFELCAANIMDILNARCRL